ncbi:unnamed protein product [Owenia fusiformis]|uniref:Uncharacterized protein n=1 Tax=Owenia fusiformis TaxID=6347 RepID=A0A8J1XKZ5_OWEFU|nr:unnamed protein product [Owenia fusiformis]
MAGAVSVGDPSGSTSIIRIMANIFISFIGAGVLGLPFAFKEAGILEGSLIMMAVGLISVKAMLLIIDCKDRLINKDTTLNKGSSWLKDGATKLILKVTEGTTEEKADLMEMEEMNGVVKQKKEPSKPEAPGQDLTYGDVGYYAMGHTGRLLVEFAIVISQVGFCCAYLIFISENLHDFFEVIKKYQWLLILLPPLAILTLLRHLNSLAISSLFAQCSNLLAFGVVFWFDFEHFHALKDIHRKEISLKGFPFFLAIAIYCYEGAGMILSLESSVAKEVRHRFRPLFKITLVIVTALYISFGVSGYLSFGPETDAIITLNLPKGESLDFALMVKSCLCLALFFTYPVMMFPVINILESKIISNPKENLWKGNILRFSIVSLTGIIVLLVPNFANLMALVGAGCCTLLAFILPGIFHLKIFQGALTKWSWTLDVCIIVIGIVGTIIGLQDAIQRLFTPNGDSDLENYDTTTLSSIADHAARIIRNTSNTVQSATQKIPIEKILKNVTKLKTH